MKSEASDPTRYTPYISEMAESMSRELEARVNALKQEGVEEVLVTDTEPGALSLEAQVALEHILAYK